MMAVAASGNAMSLDGSVAGTRLDPSKPRVPLS